MKKVFDAIVAFFMFLDDFNVVFKTLKENAKDISRFLFKVILKVHKHVLVTENAFHLL